MDFKKRNAEKDIDGVWFELEDMRIKVLHPESRRGSQAVNRAMPLVNDAKTVDDAVRKTAKTYAALIVGWEGVVEDGAVIPFSPETAEEYLYEYEELRLFVITSVQTLKEQHAAQAVVDTEVKKK